MASNEPPQIDPFLLPLINASTEVARLEQQEELARRVAPIISNEVRRHRVAPGTDRQDLEQNLHLSFLKRITPQALLNNPIAKLSAYLARSAANACVRTFATYRPERNVELTELTCALFDAIPSPEKLEKIRHFWRCAIERLTVEELRILVFAWRGLADALQELPIVNFAELERALQMPDDLIVSILDLQDNDMNNEELAAKLGISDTNRFYYVRRKVNKWINEQIYLLED